MHLINFLNILVLHVQYASTSSFSVLLKYHQSGSDSWSTAIGACKILYTSIKYDTLEGIREGVTVTCLWRVKIMWRHTFKFFIIHNYKPIRHVVFAGALGRAKPVHRAMPLTLIGHLNSYVQSDYSVSGTALLTALTRPSAHAHPTGNWDVETACNETWNWKWCLTFCCNECILTERGMDKNHYTDKIRELRQILCKGHMHVCGVYVCM